MGVGDLDPDGARGDVVRQVHREVPAGHAAVQYGDSVMSVELVWFKSSYSGGGGGKSLAVSPGAWSAFTTHAAER
ncbi:hypothetical protein [Streptomyces sp. SP18CS02]|uniref:hypothetical protein n=1 Tax=Streptomyces sp. SP18CS02 TaxID=3002531 RepID=UPI002E779AA9|nr:hypothetical protein [Streptomyces sp. SP18CS02]MEE1752206.1 hypothetical protein [Streptomyces sp. SP18CS02]